MNKSPITINPNLRNARVQQLIEQMDLRGDMATAMRLAHTPEPLHDLKDHAARGHKSLGRIQQLRNRRRFKARVAA